MQKLHLRILLAGDLFQLFGARLVVLDVFGFATEEVHTGSLALANPTVLPLERVTHGDVLNRCDGSRESRRLRFGPTGCLARHELASSIPCRHRECHLLARRHSVRGAQTEVRPESIAHLRPALPETREDLDLGVPSMVQDLLDGLRHLIVGHQPFEV